LNDLPFAVGELETRIGVPRLGPEKGLALDVETETPG